MKFHAYVEYAGGTKGWRNFSRDSLLRRVILPFMQGQIVIIGSPTYNTVLNMRSCTTLVVYKTTQEISSVEELRALPNAEDFVCTAELLIEARKQVSTAPVASLLQKSLVEVVNQVFVIMKFGDKHLDSAYEMAIRPAVESVGYRCVRIDEIQDAGRITDQILEAISVSRLILADLTGARPNCYYEAGFAHALGKEMILTIRAPEGVHFDLAGYRFIEWETEADLKRKLLRRLRALTNPVGERVEST